MHALSVSSLSKSFGSLKAVDDLSLFVEKGDFFALLGPNGAGKSTLINMVSTLLLPDQGSIEIFGAETQTQSFEAKKSLGIVPQEFNFGIFDKVIDIILNQAGYYGLERKQVYPRAEELLKKLSLYEKKDVQARMLSGGMKRRLMIARALIHCPKILILDEPTAGVDIEIRRIIWQFLEDANKEGLTIILTTHYLEEAEKLCNKVGIINHGKLLAQGSVKTLLASLQENTFVCDFQKPLEKQDVENHHFKALVQKGESRVEVTLTKTETLNDMVAFFNRNQNPIENIQPKNNRLEDIFLELTKKKES